MTDDEVKAQAMLAETLTESIPPLGKGFLLYTGVIIALGPQNLFVLRQGLRRRHLFVTALLSTLADAFLIIMAVGGLGAFISASRSLSAVTVLGGIIFLIGYGVWSVGTAWRRQTSRETEPAAILPLPASLKGTVLATLSFALLNPGSYVDTLLMVGTVSVQYSADQRVIFAVGVVLASALWFFSLAYGAGQLAPLLRRPQASRVLDMVSGCLMIGMACYMFMTQNVWL